MADPTIDERLAAIRERARKATAGPWAQLEKATAERDAALAEVERLSAIVARLPKTADGVPVVPGMNIYIPGPSSPDHAPTDVPYECGVLSVEWAGEGESHAVNIRDGDGYETEVWLAYCYSTRAAAEAAAKAGGGE